MLTSNFYTLYPFILLAMNVYSLFLSKKTTEFSTSSIKNPFEYSNGLFHDPLNKSDLTKPNLVVKRLVLIHGLMFTVYWLLSYLTSQNRWVTGYDFVLGMIFFFNVEFLLNLFSIYTQYLSFQQPDAFSGKLKVNSGVMLKNKATQQIMYAALWTVLFIATNNAFFLGGTVIAAVAYFRNRALGNRLINQSQKANRKVE